MLTLDRAHHALKKWSTGKFNNRDKKEAIIKASKIKKLDSSFLGITPATPIFCDDHLIPENKRILAKAKQLKKEGVFK